jgi:hypothetical protein
MLLDLEASMAGAGALARFVDRSGGRRPIAHDRSGSPR